MKSRFHGRVAAIGVAAITTLGLPAIARSAPLQISSDPFTQATCKASTTTNHHTEVEPDSFSNGSTIVSAFQVGRVYDAGVSRTCWRNSRMSWPGSAGIG